MGLNNVDKQELSFVYYWTDRYWQYWVELCENIERKKKIFESSVTFLYQTQNFQNHFAFFKSADFQRGDALFPAYYFSIVR